VAQVGDMVYLHDRVTKVSRKNVMRWCMVVARNGSISRVCPRSTTVVSAIFSIRGELPEFDEPGWFSRFDRPVPTKDVDAARNIGQLPEPTRTDVLDLYLPRAAS
jgi:hypothetical protein